MEKFTVIITHYNQMQYIEEALKSVLKQSYKNIELIIADDCSMQFNKKKVKEIIEKYNKKNYSYKIVQGKKNVGTVKNLNNALNEATGNYILFFAADDKLDNTRVISNFVSEFKDENKNVITSQCGLYDKDLKKKISDYVNNKIALKLNKKTSDKMYEKMCEGCFYGAGGTAYRKQVFEKYGPFNEKYIYVEDWAYWLHILRNGEKIYYADFDTLCHRDGGISHSTYTKKTIPPHVKQYYKDILNIYESEVIPYLDKFTTKEQYKILKQYNQTILYYLSFVPELFPYLKRLDEIRIENKKLKYYWKLQTFKSIFSIHLIEKIKILFKYNKVVPITAIVWVIISFLLINSYNFPNNNYLLGACIILYIIIYYIIYMVNRMIYYFDIIKTKNRG